MMRVNSAPLCILVFLVLPLATTCQTRGDLPSALRAGGGVYFMEKMENLKTQLNLTPEQQAKVKPIAEQEQAYYEQIHANPVLSQKEKFKRLKALVHDSDKLMKPILSSEQWQKLQVLRKDQQRELEALVALEDVNER